jgi:hypothetical protein
MWCKINVLREGSGDKMRKVTISQILVWIAQTAMIGFMIPTVVGFFSSPDRMLTLEGSYFLIPIIIGLIGYSVVGEMIAVYVMGLTAFILLIMLICVIFLKRALKYGVFLFAVLLLDLTTMIAWYKGEIFEIGYVTTIFYVHIVVMALLVVGMIGGYRFRVDKHLKEVELEERSEAEVEFEVRNKLVDPQFESKENTDDSVSSDS